MVIRKFKNPLLKDWEIVNEAGWTRNGFYHRSVLMWKGHDRNEAKLHYLNRTWECYEFQSSMRQAVYNEKELIKNIELKHWKEMMQVTRMTKDKKERFEKYLKDNKILDVYELMLKEIEWRD